MTDSLANLVLRQHRTQRAIHEILQSHEAAESRVVYLRDSFTRLEDLPVDVAQYYREALQALQVGCYRAAVVLSWAGFVYTLVEYMVTNHAAPLASHYPKWKTGTVTTLLETTPEAQLLDAARTINIINKQKLNIYKGWLSVRNQCAHPTLYVPSRNVALGYVDAVASELVDYL